MGLAVAALEPTVTHLGGRLLAVARRVLRDPDEAADALQEAYLSAHRGLGRFQSGAQLSTWLHRIVVNAALMRLRARRRRPEVSLEEAGPAVDVRESAEAAEESAARAELRALVRRAIAGLPARHRRVLLLRDVAGLDTEETAAALGIGAAAVRSRLHRARAALRGVLAPHLG